MAVLARKGARYLSQQPHHPPELSIGPFYHAAEVMQSTTDPLLTGTQSSYEPTS